MVLSTAMPITIAAMVMVMMSSEIPSQPISPSTCTAATMLGIIAIAAIFRLWNDTMNISMMARNTTPRVSIWERNRLCSMLL